MDWLNYHHLLYFWSIARHGSLARAAAQLRLAPSTLSGQVHVLESSLGEKLFIKSGRRLVLTETGRVVFRYADEIFTLGRELRDAVSGRGVGRPQTLVVGIADVVPKLVAWRLLEVAVKRTESFRLVCREGNPARLLADLAVHELDVVISDSPVEPSIRVRAFSHLLGESTIVFCGTAKLVNAYKRGFPESLTGAPVILPAENTALRRSLDQWFHARNIRPELVGEFEDSALMKVVGQAGMGLFPVCSVVAKEVERQYQVRRLGVLDEVRERFYAISVERKLKHPGVVTITEEARQRVFS